MKTKKIVVKLGTNAMTNEDGSLNKGLIQDLVRQISELMKEYEVLLVTSGAMGSGRDVLKKELKYDEVTKRQIYAVVGQVRLMEMYANFFHERGKIVAQMLATKDDFSNRTHFLNTKNCIESLFREGIVPIMNENDFVCVEELMFTDNDELAGMISKMIFADKLIILSNVDGIYDESGQVIKEFQPEDEMPKNIISASKSSFGKGGMQNKFGVAHMVANSGTEVFITSSKSPDALVRIMNGELVGTHFVPTKN